MQPHLSLDTIIEGCLNACSKSQYSFYRYFYAFCFSVCSSYCKSNDDIQEVVNDGFLKIFNNLQNFSASYNNYEVPLRGWIKKIMINTSIDHYNKNRKKFSFGEIDERVFKFSVDKFSPIDKIYYKEISKLVYKLSPAYRKVFNLYAIQGFKHEEIAKELNISVGTSKSNLAKARVNIQKMKQV